jgi:hypothetical protein
VFVLSCFDPSVASRSPEKILTVGESSGGNSAKGKQARQSPTNEVAESIGTGSELGSGQPIANTISASIYHHGTVVNQDANNGHVVIEEPFTASSHAGYTDGVGTLRANGGDLGGAARHCWFTSSQRL